MPTITFKVTAREAARIRQLARREGITISEFLRRRAVQVPPSPTGAYRIATSAITGLPVMQAPPGTPTVSSEHIRGLLLDFP